MNVYHITRNRLVTERFRVMASSEEEAIQTLSDEMDLPQVTENCEITDMQTLQSNILLHWRGYLLHGAGRIHSPTE